MPLPQIDTVSGLSAVNTVRDGGAEREIVALATRFILQELARVAPGHSVEVRVPPFGATQIVEGPGHTRGTPPNVIELNPQTLIALALGDITWSAARASGSVVASGTRATLEDLMPLRFPAE